MKRPDEKDEKAWMKRPDPGKHWMKRMKRPDPGKHCLVI